MSATPVASVRTQKEIWTPVVLPGETSAISALLDLAIVQTSVRAAYVYRFDRYGADSALVAFVGPTPEKQGFELAREVASLHWNRRTPVVLRSGAASDWRFSSFAELRTGRFDGVVSTPLLDLGETVGLANFCLRGDEPLSGSALSFLMNLTLPLGAVLVAAALKGQLLKAHQELADRKVLDRAKGICRPVSAGRKKRLICAFASSAGATALP